MSITLLTGRTPRILELPTSHPRSSLGNYAVLWDEQDAEGHEIITYGFMTSAAAERAIMDLYAEQCGQANELARDSADNGGQK